MILTVDYLPRYASEEQLLTLGGLERVGWEATHLFTMPDHPGRVLVWCISRGLVSRNKKSAYSHMWIDRKGVVHRWPSQLSRASR